VNLGADLADALVPVHRIAHRQRFGGVQAHGLLQVDVLAGLHGFDGHQCVPMRRRGDDHGIHVGSRQQFAEIAVAFGCGLVNFESFLAAFRGNVADGGHGDVRVLGAIGQIAAPHAVHADDPKADAIARRRLPRPAERGGRNDGGNSNRRGDGGLEHPASGDISISWHSVFTS